MSADAFVPQGFVPPSGLDHPDFRLRPLGPEHNVSDYAAWTSSAAHIHATPGYEGSSWPREMTIDENLADLTRHAEEFATNRGFAYTVLAPGTETVIGCVYIYPSKTPGYGALIRSWVRAADADLDPVLHRAVADWLASSWPFERVEYAARPGA